MAAVAIRHRRWTVPELLAAAGLAALAAGLIVSVLVGSTPSGAVVEPRPEPALPTVVPVPPVSAGRERAVAPHRQRAAPASRPRLPARPPTPPAPIRRRLPSVATTPVPAASREPATTVDAGPAPLATIPAVTIQALTTPVVTTPAVTVPTLPDLP